MKKISFAIIGCGQIAQRHAKHIANHGSLVAVCDIVESKAALLAQQYNTVIYLEIEDLLSAESEIDVVAICTPNGLHAKHSILALEAGHHVLVEKPMGLTTGDCQKMMEAALVSNKHLFPVMQNRFNPPVLAVKKAIDDNAFGKIASIQLSCLWNRANAYYQDSWHGTRDMDGGILFTQFSHFVDLLYWFFGDVRDVSAITKNAVHGNAIEFEDCGVVLLEFENGIIGSIHFSINAFGQNREGALTISGEKGMVKIGGEYLNTVDYQQFADYRIDESKSTPEANDYGTYKGSMSNHDKVYQNLVDTLMNGTPFYVSTYEGFKTVELIERIYAAANTITQ